ncbi:kinase-like domain-containing protein [Gloeopeniophorella convolvens]|nr:kinase-like domain-containing protein [Gloeopeniophorella convolvens]
MQDATHAATEHGGEPGRQIGTLFSSEEWWRDRYIELEERGYRLRTRYSPSWQPSWKRTGQPFFSAEDGQPMLLRAAMDASRVADGKQVMLKKLLEEDGSQELAIIKTFSSPDLATDPRNHCVPLLDLIELPDSGHPKLMAMPYLRRFDKPRFQTYGEFVSFFSQICEGLQFMHERNVAHRDCTANNIMLDPTRMYPRGFHPVQINRSKDFKGRAMRYTRTATAPRYYLIDFGLSRQYASRDVMEMPLRGGDKTAPEHQTPGRQCNPFQTDIYYLGNLVHEEFIRKYLGFEFMEGLVERMTNEDPAKRPTIEEVLASFTRIRESMSASKLRSTITSIKDPALFTAFRHTRQAVRTAQYVILRKPAIPDPR